MSNLQTSGDWTPGRYTTQWLPMVGDAETTRDFRFAVFTNPSDGQPYVVVAEVLERLGDGEADKAVQIRGGKFIDELDRRSGISICLQAGSGWNQPKAPCTGHETVLACGPTDDEAAIHGVRIPHRMMNVETPAY